MQCNLKNWQITFQVLDYKRKDFLNLNDNNDLPIRPTYSKDGAQLKLIKHSNSLCIQATKAITNYALIGKYYLRFFPKKSFACLYSEYSIESRNYILHNYRKYIKYQNPNRVFEEYHYFF